MENQSSQQPGVQFPILPTEQTQPDQIISSPIQPQTPIIETTPTQSEIPQTPKPLYKNKVFLVVGILVLILILSGGYYTYARYKINNSPIPNMYPNWTPYPMSSFVPSTMAPIPTAQEFRSPKGNANDVINLSDAAKINLGVIKVPSTVTFIHTEVYKDITIEWTAGQPIPADRLQWIKDAIDKSPDFYTKKYPPQAIISASAQEINLDSYLQSQIGITLAAARGTNIFLWPNFFAQKTDSSYYQTVNEIMARQVLMHEWMHIVQYYDGVETYTDDYLTHDMAGTYDLDYKDPLVQKFGNAVGWYYEHDYSPVPTLKTDTESQKTTDYGKQLEYEDMADTASHVITCDTSTFSQARIDIMSQILGQSAQSFCQ